MVLRAQIVYITMAGIAEFCPENVLPLKFRQSEKNQKENRQSIYGILLP